MFYQVRVLDRKGKIKKVLSSKSLSKRYWNSFFDTNSAVAGLKKSKVKKEFKMGKESKIGYKDLFFSED